MGICKVVSFRYSLKSINLILEWQLSSRILCSEEAKSRVDIPAIVSLMFNDFVSQFCCESYHAYDLVNYDGAESMVLGLA